jgi:uncharacterized membrane protein
MIMKVSVDDQRLGPGPQLARTVLMLLLVATFLAAGIIHIALPRPFISITPNWVPHPELVIFATGLCEMAGAVALLVPPLRRLSGAMLALYALCVWPANMKHAWLHAQYGMPPGWWYHGPRLLLQPVIIWWCLFAGGVIDWPFGRARGRVA